jgi:SPP1 family predicted phage head-tail adaptor
LTFQTQSTGQDASGEPLDTWTDAFTVWGSVEDLSGKEVLRDGAFSAQITTVVTIRHREGILSGQRIIVGSRTLELAAPPIDKTGRVREMELLCKEITP